MSPHPVPAADLRHAQQSDRPGLRAQGRRQAGTNAQSAPRRGLATMFQRQPFAPSRNVFLRSQPSQREAPSPTRPDLGSGGVKDLLTSTDCFEWDNEATRNAGFRTDLKLRFDPLHPPRNQWLNIASNASMLRLRTTRHHVGRTYIILVVRVPLKAAKVRPFRKFMGSSWSIARCSLNGPQRPGFPNHLRGRARCSGLSPSSCRRPSSP